MNLSWIDWSIMIVAVVALRVVSLSTRRYMKGVSDFLAANRLAGRYLLTIAQEMGGFGVVSFIALFEKFMSAGLAPDWWGGFSIPMGVVILLTGWVFYRFRETRALTMAQFLEMRYSRRFRIYAGLLCWTSGILNFGIFPAVAARFFIYFCGLPDHFYIPGLDFPLPSIAVVMLVDLGFAITFVNMGGQISVMITDCVQGMFCGFAFMVVVATILVKVHWSQMVEALSMAPPNQSMLNPFHTSGITDFNIWYYLIALFGGFYSYMSWQGTSGFNSSARTPHEQKMGGIIRAWRWMPHNLMTVLLALAALAVTRLPEFAETARIVSDTLAKIPNESVQGQMRVPVTMAHFLPIGVKGLLATIFLFFSFTCHDTYMHSWGSIFVQDVYLPLRKKPMTPEQHIKFLRWSIIGVAIFSFFFSLFYQPSEKIFFFFAITGTIWAGGSGAVILGGLYWKRGTTAAAFCALTVGAVVGVGGLIIPKMYKASHGVDFPINNQWLWFMAMVSAGVIYIVVSMLFPAGEREYNLERMLHRGRYRIKEDHVPEEEVRSKWQQIVGITKEFSRGDRFLALALVAWNAGWFAWFVVFSLANLFFPISDMAWARYWHIQTIIIPCIISVPATVWFTVGGVHDIRALFKSLTTAKRDVTDDGRVRGWHEPDETAEDGDAEADESEQTLVLKETD